MTGITSQVLIFLIEILFGGYLLILMLRLILQARRSSVFNPVFQGLIKITEPPVKPFRTFFPRFHDIELSVVAVLIILEIIKYLILSFLSSSVSPGFAVLIVSSIMDLVQLAVNVFFYSILIVVVVSWLNPTLRSPLMECLQDISEILLSPARRIIPPIAGLDLSPVIVLILLKVVLMFVQSFLLSLI